MNLGDVFAALATLIGLGIALPGMWLAWALIFPETILRAKTRLQRTPWRCFWLGGILFAASLLPILILLSIKAGPVQFFGWAMIFILLAIASLGGAGLAMLMGERLRGGGMNVSSGGALVRGAVALELAVIFPVVGWFIVLPLLIVTTLGASAFALLRWMPRALTNAVSETSVRMASDG